MTLWSQTFMGSSRPAEGSQLMSVQDPDATNEDTDEVLTRQFTAFGDALGDDCPAVRAETVTGLAGLLDTFWELVPGALTAGFLQRIVGESFSVCLQILLGMYLHALSTSMSPLPDTGTSGMSHLGSDDDRYAWGSLPRHWHR